MSRIGVRISGSYTGTAAPPSWHGVFKGPHNTGLPAGWTPTTRMVGQTLSTPGAVYQDVDFVSEGVVIAADNVTLQRCRMTTLATSGTRTGVVAQDCLLEYVDCGGMTFRRCEIFRRFGNPVSSDLSRALSDGYMQDCWLHGPKYVYGEHVDTWQAATLNISNMSLVRCKLDFEGLPNGNGCMQFAGGLSYQNLLVEDNHFLNSNLGVNGATFGAGSSNILFRGNIWGNYPAGFYIAPAVKNSPGVTFGPNNVTETTGAVVV